ncbi:MAG: EAL domain-containing protein [Ruminococcaceae bacterium]|nr:EAL domain-containing protein [Oscillospiraceae bacterium]
MNEQKWKRTEYDTWDDAFRGLAPAIRQQSVRVAAYTRVLFVQACKMGYGRSTPEGAERMDGKYADLAYKCGMYHQLGKALVPPEYQIWQADFTEEEKAVYRKYTSDGRLLVATLQMRSVRAKEKRKGELVEQSTKNIPWLMQRETCQQHMEHWDGSGYPEGKRGAQISPIAHIVGLAKELDRLVSETKSEIPFAEAMNTLLTRGGSDWDPALIKVLEAARNDCAEVYQKYIHYTMTLPQTIPLVQKREGRPLGLKYRPMVADCSGKVAYYEAVPWFGGIAGRPGETEGTDDLAAMLRRTELIGPVSLYLAYEAADAALRIQNCKLDLGGIVLQMPPDFYLTGSQLKRLNQMFAEQEISKEQLIFTVPAATVIQAGKGTREVLNRYLRNGVRLLLDDYNPAQLPLEQVKELGFTDLRLAKELYVQQETANLMYALRQQGFTLWGGNADDHDTLAWLVACGVIASSGTITGAQVDENELIRDSLMSQRRD